MRKNGPQDDKLCPQAKALRAHHTGDQYSAQMQEQREDEAGGRWCVAWILGCVALTLLLSLVTCSAVAQEVAPPAQATDAQIEDAERWLRDAYEARRKQAQDAGDDVARQAWLLRRRLLDTAISARELQDETLPPEQAPAVEPAPPTDEDTYWAEFELELGEGRTLQQPIKDRSAMDFIVHRPTRTTSSGAQETTHAAWFVDGRYALINGVISGYGGEGSRWGQGIYARHSQLSVDGLHIYAPLRRERLSRDHPIYLSGSSMIAGTLLIGHPEDFHDHDIDINVTAGDLGPQAVEIDTLVVIGGHRVVVEVDEGALARLHIGTLIVIDPVGAPIEDGRVWDGIEIDGCPDIEIGEYIVLDRSGRITRLALIDADDCEGAVASAQVYAPNADTTRDLIQGVEGEVVWLDAAVEGDLPGITGAESVPALLAWMEGRDE